MSDNDASLINVTVQWLSSLTDCWCYSRLRKFLISFLTISAWLVQIIDTPTFYGLVGDAVQRAQQREDVERQFRDAYLMVKWDYQKECKGGLKYGKPGLPTWLLDIVGKHLFYSIVLADFDNHFANDKMMALLEHFPCLEDLHVYDAKVTSDGLAVLAKLPHLRTLHMYSFSLNDQGLKYISECGSLEEITIEIDPDARTATDDGLEYLKSLKKLRRLCIAGKFSAEAVRRLKEALPQCDIDFDDF